MYSYNCILLNYHVCISTHINVSMSSICTLVFVSICILKIKTNLKKYILRGQRNTRYHERIPSNKKKSLDITYICQFSQEW